MFYQMNYSLLQGLWELLVLWSQDFCSLHTVILSPGGWNAFCLVPFYRISSEISRRHEVMAWGTQKGRLNDQIILFGYWLYKTNRTEQINLFLTVREVLSVHLGKSILAWHSNPFSVWLEFFLVLIKLLWRTIWTQMKFKDTVMSHFKMDPYD